MIVLGITGTVDPGYLAGLDALKRGQDAAGASSEAAGAKAAAAGPRWAANIDALRRGAQAFNETHAAISTVIGTLAAAVSRVGALSDEQARLNLTSRRLGLDFDEAAASAGRFVDETEAMGVANRFAAADLNLTQQQLNDVMRVAGSAADTLGTDTAGAVDTLREALISGRERGLMQFGEEMRRTAGHAHTVEERFAALHAQAGRVTAAVDDSAAAMARFRDTIEDSERTVASALTSELAHISSITTETGHAADGADDWNTKLRAVGSTLGYLSGLALSGLQIVGGAVGSVIGGITGTISIAAAGMEGLVSTRSLAGARAAIAAEIASLRTDGLAQQASEMLAAGIRSAERIADDQGSQRTTAPPDAPPAARPTARRQHAAGAGGNAHRGVDMTITAEQVAADDVAATDALLGIDRAAETERRGRAEVDALIETEQQRQQVAAHAEQVANEAADREVQRSADERDRLIAQLDAHERYTGRLAELYATQASAAGIAADSTKGAFDAVGGALSKNAQALIDGRASVGEALQGMLADTLQTIGKQEVIEGGVEVAKGLGALAGVVTAPLAPGHFAAAAAHFAIGAAAGVAGAAAAPSAGSAGAGAGAGRGAGGLLPDRAAAGAEGAGPAVVNNFYAPTFGNGRSGSDAEAGMQMNRYTDAERRRTQRAA